MSNFIVKLGRALIGADESISKSTENTAEDHAAHKMLPKHLQVSYDQAGQHLIQGKFKEAASLFFVVLKEHPNDFGSLLGLGNALNCMQLHSEARDYLMKAVKSITSTSDLAPVHFGLGWSYSGLGEKTVALSHLDIAISHCGDNRLYQEIIKLRQIVKAR